MNKRKYAVISLCSYGLAACSYHVVPPANYSAADAGFTPVVTIAFDQDGNIYPFSPNELKLEIPAQPGNTNSAFTLTNFYQVNGGTYDSAVLTQQAVERISETLSNHPDSRLVFLIHGFNNSFGYASESYDEMRHAIQSVDPEAQNIFVQVHWDGLFKGSRTAPLPLSYFGKSLTYSNLAGMCGLRRIISNLSAETDITYVTHSRGAAVALSAATDPEWDDGIRKCSPPDRPTGELAGDVRLLAFAPAVGDGHMRDSNGDPQLQHYDYFDRIYVGFNPQDPATGKQVAGFRIGGRRGGDTRFGSEQGYIDIIEGASDGRMQYVTYEHQKHSWAAYLRERSNSTCLMWASKLISVKPQDCSLER